MDLLLTAVFVGSEKFVFVLVGSPPIVVLCQAAAGVVKIKNIEEIITEAKELGIQTLDERDLESLIKNLV